MKIPLVDLKAQYQNIKSEINSAIQEVFTNSQFILGPQLQEFENNYAAYCEAKYCIGVSSGTSAIYLALLALNIKPGDEIITTPYTFIATTECISLLGANIKFVDIDETTYNIDVTKIEKAISNKTKAIIPVHLFGQICEMNAIKEIASKYNLNIIEDSAQAHGAEYYNKKSPIDKTACYSFFPSKTLGAYGDAGAVVTNDESMAEKIRLLRFHGTKDKKSFFINGFNHRLDNIQAAMLNVKLKYLDKWVQRRRQIAKLYNEIFNNYVITPLEKNNHKNSYYLYIIRSKKRNELQDYLNKSWINTAIYYDPSLHLQPVYNYLKHKKGSFPVTENIASEAIALPMYPELTDEQVIFVANKIKEFHKNDNNN